MGIADWLRRRSKKEENHSSPSGTEDVKRQDAEPKEAVDEHDSKLTGSEQQSPRGLFARLREGLSRTRSSFVGRVDSLLSSRRRIDEELFLKSWRRYLSRPMWGRHHPAAC